MNIKYGLVLCTAILLMSCGEKKKHLAYYDSADAMADSIVGEDLTDGGDNSEFSELSASEVSVPFEEKSGVKLIDVTVNGQFTVKMILDSGCSGTLISIAEAKYLYDKGVHYDIFRKLGAHPSVKDGRKGIHFAVWAPHAAAVHLR